jgi:PAS domain S-box-containing protein
MDCIISDRSFILVVDDDAAHAESVRQLLMAHQHTVVVETDPAVALRRAQSDPPAVLVLDLNMPGMTGVELLEALVQVNRSTKAIVVSGEQAHATVSPLLRLGAYDFISKPFVPDQLVRSVSRALEQWQLEQSHSAMQLREERANELNRFLLDAFPDLLYMLDKEGNFSFINNQLEYVFDADRQALAGQSWQSLFADPALRKRLQNQINERREGPRKTRHLEFEVTSRTGGTILIQCSARGLYRPGPGAAADRFVGTYGVLQDVTDARQARREQLQSQRKFQALVMESPDAVFISRASSGEVLEANEIFRGWQTADTATDHFLWPSPAAREEFINALRRSPEHLSLSVERSLAGNPLYLEINARLLELEDEDCMLATVRDRSRERRAELQQQELQFQLQQAGKMEALGQLAGGIAHDFNNILASIIGYAELVLTSRHRLDGTRIDGYLREVVTAGHRARDLISQMLTFTRASRGEPRPVDIGGAIEDVSRMLRAAIPSTIRIETLIEPGLRTVRLDPIQFQQVVMNLMINARDAIVGTGRITLRLAEADRCPACQICGESVSGKHVAISVEDTGHGIKPEDLPRIFDMYFTTREPGKGTGIGLWLVDGMVHSAGGHLSVDSVPGQGTRFTLHLPFEPEIKPAATTPSSSTALAGRIVVVDDEVSVSSFLGEILRHSGYETVVFNESPKALDYLVQHLDDVALLLTDQAMPMLSGLDLAQFVKGRKPEMPVVLITGFSQAHDARKLEEIGVDHYLIKPFGIESLLEVVRSATQSETPREPNVEGVAIS